MTLEEEEVEEDIQEAQKQADNLKDNLDDIEEDIIRINPKYKKFLSGLFTFVFVSGTFIAVMIVCILFGRINAAQEICENLEMIPVKDALLDNEMTCVHEDRLKGSPRTNQNDITNYINFSDLINKSGGNG